MLKTFRALILASSAMATLSLAPQAQAAPPLVKIFDYYSDAAHQNWTGT